MRKICVVTGSRAEYGILAPLMRMLEDSPEVELQVVAINMHLSPEHGLTYREIEADGFHIDAKVEMMLSSDTSVGTAKSMGLACIGLADAFDRLHPDLLLILGDRHEMLAVAQTALVMHIPIAHVHGGELTYGAYDDAVRHAITKLSHLHFTSTEEYRRRVIRMGENPGRVFWTGAPGVDNIARTEILSRRQLEDFIGFTLGDRYLVATFHPVTMEPESVEAQAQAFVDGVRLFLDSPQGDGYHIIFSMPNSDAGNHHISSRVRQLCAEMPDRAFSVASLGRVKFYTALAGADAMVGNSSSALIEAPEFKVPVVNIGNRQKGRARGGIVVDSAPEAHEIAAAINRAIDLGHAPDADFSNPYRKDGTLDEMLRILTTFPLSELSAKEFYEEDRS